MPKPAQSEFSRTQAWLLIIPLVLLTGFASALAGGCNPLMSIAVIPASDFMQTLSADYTIPEQMTINVGDTVQFVAVSYMPGMTPGVIPAGTQLAQVALPAWNSSNTAVASIGTSGANEGLATGVSAGTTTLTVVSGTLTDTFQLTVRSQADVRVNAVAGNSVPAGDPQQLIADVSTDNAATGVVVEFFVPAGGPVNVTTTAPVVCPFNSNTGKATCPPQNMPAGTTVRLVVDLGSLTPGQFNVQTTVTANEPDPNQANNTQTSVLTWATAVLRSLVITPSATQINDGGLVDFTLTGIRTDGSTVDLTADPSIIWTSMNPSVVSTPTLGQNGLQLSQGHNLTPSPLTATITALDPVTNISQSVTITVDPRPVPLTPVALIYSADGNSNTVSRFELAETGQLTFIGADTLGGAGNTTGVATAEVGSGTVLAATYADNKVAVATANANGTVTPWIGSPFTTSGAPSDPEFYFDGSNLFLYFISGGTAVDAFLVNTQTQTLNQVAGAPFSTGTTVQDIQVNAARKTLDVVPTSTAVKTFVIPHILDTSGAITAAQPTFDTTIFSTYSGLNSGTGAVTADSSSVQLYLFNQNTGQPIGGARDSEVCANCKFVASPGALCVVADETPAGQPTRKATFQIDELSGSMTRVSTTPNAVRLGFGVIVVTGDSTGANIQSFVANTQTGPFDLSVFGFDPTPISATPMSAQREDQPSHSSILPACNMSSPANFFASSAGGGATDVAVKVLISAPAPQPAVINFTTTVNGNMVSLDATASTVANGVISQIYTDCDSDGTYDAFGETPQCAYAAPGTYNITVLAINNAGQSSTLTQPVVIQATLTGIMITPDPVSIADGLNLQLTATGLFNDNTTQDLTNAVTWTSSNSAFATVSNAGVLTAVDPGMTDVTATFGAFSDSVSVTVTQASLASIEITPPSATVVLGVPLAFTATGTFTDGSTLDVTNTATWTSSDNALATVSNGQVTTIAVGAVNITAAIGTISDTAPVVINVSQPPVALFTCVETTAFTLDCDASASNDPDGGVIQTFEWDYDNNGAFEATGVTTSHAYAMAGAFTVRLRVTDDEGSTAVTSQQFTLTAPPQPPVASYSCTSRAADPRIVDCDGSASSDPDGGLISLFEWDFDNDATIDATGPTASFTYPVSGTKTIVLRVTDDENVTASLSQPFIINPVLLSLVVAPDQPSLADGLSLQCTATGTFDDGSMQDLTNSVSWSSADNALATVSNTGQVTAVNPGAVVITATSGTISDSTTVTVTNAVITSLDVTPDNISLADGLDQQFTAIATLTDGSTLDLTNTATWTSSAPAFATVNAAGLVHTVDPGVVQITATYTDTFGTFTDTSTVTVTQAVLTTVAVTPDPPPSIADGHTLQFTATGTFSDGNTSDITNSCSWSTSDSAIATINPTGLATGVDPGSTTVTADCSGITDSVTLVITQAVLESIAISPDPPPTVTVNGTTQLMAIGNFSDGSTQDVTALATWTSSDNAIATVSDTAGSKGLVTGVALGSFSVTATMAPFSDTVFATVSSVALQLITNAGINELAAGDDPGFFVSINNNGTGATGNLQMDATFTGATLTNVFPPFGWTCMQNGNSVSCTTASLGGFSGAHFFFGIDTSFLAGGGNVTLDATVTSTAPVINLQSQASATVYPVLQLNVNLPKAGGNVPYMGVVGASGGKTPHTFGVQFGSFPNGLNFDPATGAVTGIATAGGSFPITLFAQDSLPNPQVVASNVTLDVLFIATPSLLNGTAASPYIQSITVIGQTIDPNTIGQFRISAGMLPDGLAIDAFSGAISGTPTNPGAFNFTVEYEETQFSMTGGPNIVTKATQPYTVTIHPAGTPNIFLNVTGPFTGPTILPIPIQVTINAINSTFTNQTFTVQASPRVLTQFIVVNFGNATCPTTPPFVQGNVGTCTIHSVDSANPVSFTVVGFADHPAAGMNETFTFTLSPGGGDPTDDSFVQNFLAVGGGQITIVPQNFSVVVGDPDMQFNAFASPGGYDITEHVNWSTSNNAVATVSNAPPKGLLHPLMPGSITVRAFESHNFALGQSFGNIFSVVGLAVTPGILNQAVGNTVQMQANLLLNNGALHTDVTTRANWSTNNASIFDVETTGDAMPGLVTMTGAGATSGAVMDPVSGLSRNFTVNGFATQPQLNYIFAMQPGGIDSFFLDTATGDLHFVGADRPVAMGSIVALETCEDEIFGGFFGPHNVSSSRVDNTTGLPMGWHTTEPVAAPPSDVKTDRPCRNVGAVLSGDSSVQMFSRNGPDITPTAKTTIPGTFPVKMFFNPNHPFAYLCNGDQLRVLTYNATAGTVTDNNNTRNYMNRRDFAISRNGDALYIITLDFGTNTSNFILQQLSNGDLGGPPISVALPKIAFAVYSDPDSDVAYVLHFDNTVTTVQLNIAAGTVTIGPNVPAPGIDTVLVVPGRPWFFYSNFFSRQICRVNRGANGILSGAPVCFGAQVPASYQRLVHSPNN